MNLLRQPLIHFLLLGGLLFVAFELINSEAENDNPRKIRVDREMLLEFMQYRSKAFNAQSFSQKLDAMPLAERKRLIDDLVREEVLFREAKSLGLENDDYIIKRRLIQKLEFITKNFSELAVDIDEKALEDYYQQNKQKYYVEPRLSFTHVFFSHQLHGEQQALELASTLLKEFTAKGVSFAESLEYGDRFLYHSNYIERSASLVSSHFGQAMTDKLLAQQSNETRWQGPLQSDYGQHLVMLVKNTPGHYPSLADLRENLTDNLRRQEIQKRNEQTLQALVKAYEISVEQALLEAKVPLAQATPVGESTQ